MYRMNYDEVLKLKADIAKAYPDKIHFHDSCGGQYFSLEEKNDLLKNYIIEYFADRGFDVVFSDDGMNFRIEKHL